MSSRNNQDRLAQQAGNDNNDQPNQQKRLAFSVPTEFVDLPSKGLYYPEGHVLHNIDQVEIKHMTAKEEDILASESLIKKGVVIDRLLESVIMTPNLNVSDLLAGDKNALIVAARVSGYGSDYTTVVTCPACESKTEKNFNLEEYETVGATYSREEMNESLEGVEATENSTFKATLPKSGFEVEFRLLTGADEKKVEEFQKVKKRNGTSETSTFIDTLAMIMVSVDGVNDRMQIAEFAENMPATDSKFLRKLYQALTPNVSLKQEFVCSACGYERDLEVPITTDFFWPQQ